MLFCRIRMSKKPNLILRLCYVDYKRKQSDGTYQRTMSKELLMEIFPNRNIRQGIALTKGLHVLRYCTTEKRPVRWWSWWGFSCNHLPHLVVMATQPEARALGRRGGNREREGCWEAWPAVWLPCLSFHASTNWTWHKRRRKKNPSTTLERSVNQSVTFTSIHPL